MKYVVKFKARQGFSNIRTGTRYSKGKTYVKKFTPKQYSTIKSLHKIKGYVMKMPYKIISVKKK